MVVNELLYNINFIIIGSIISFKYVSKRQNKILFHPSTINEANKKKKQDLLLEIDNHILDRTYIITRQIVIFGIWQ